MSKFKQTIQRMNRIDTFSPYFFLPFILFLYFFTSLFDFYRFDYFEVNVSIVPPLLLAFTAYYASVYLAHKRGWVFPTLGLGFLKGKTIILLYILGIIGLVAYLIMLFTGQVGITDESVRRNLDPKLNFLSSLLWFAIIFLICHHLLKQKELTRKKQLIYGGILVLVFGLFILMGYRTPIIVMFFTSLIVFHYIIKKIKLTWFLIFLLVIGLVFSMFGFWRIVSEDTTQEFNNREQPGISEELDEETIRDQNLAIQRKINETPKAIRAINSESVTGHIVLSKLMEYTDENGLLGGQLHYGVFGTVLPGEQTSPRAEVTTIVNSLTEDEGKYITRPGRTTTPTLIGQLYADFGYIGVAVGFALVGLIISMLYNQVRQTGIKSYQTVGYAFVMTIFTVSLHTGLLDLIFILMIGYAILTAGIEKERKAGTVDYRLED